MSEESTTPWRVMPAAFHMTVLILGSIGGGIAGLVVMDLLLGHRRGFAAPLALLSGLLVMKLMSSQAYRKRFGPMRPDEPKPPHS